MILARANFKCRTGRHGTNDQVGFGKDAGKNPAQVAQEILKICASREFVPQWVSSVNAAGPYVNFVLKSDALVRALFDTLKKTKQFGVNNFGKRERVMIEYPSPNTQPIKISLCRSVTANTKFFLAWSRIGTSKLPTILPIP